MTGGEPGDGRVIGRYVLCDEIAAGGMATVHIGRLIGAAGFARTVAIKRLHAQFAKDPEFVAMFLDEARIAARVRHPNVASTIDVVVLEGELFVAMEYVHGEALSRLLRASRAQTGRGVPLPIAVSIISGALYGLHAAHEARDDHDRPLDVVHRDVSPQNVLVGVDGIARVVDFGVAKATGRLQTTREGALKGKLPYMSPEQIGSENVDRRTDVYAASVVLWEMLAGRRLFHAENEAGTMKAVLEGRIDPPSRHAPELSPEVDALVLKGLSHDPGARFATAWEMAEAAQRLAYATPGQVGGWVQTLEGASLGQRAARVAEIESTSRRQPVNLAELSASSAPTRVREPSPLAAPTAPWPPAPAAGPGGPEAPPSQVSAFNMTPPLPQRSRATLALAFLVPVALAVAVALVLTIQSLATAPGPAAASAPPPAAVPAPESAASTVAPPPSPPPSPSTASAEPAPAPAPPTGSAEPAPRATAKARPRSVRSSCSPPYTVDARGIRVPKMECL